MDHSTKLNGYKPRSWGDLAAIALLMTMLLSTVAWGLKLESELNSVRDRVGNLRAEVGQGILPRAEERIQDLEREHTELSAEFDAFVQWHRDNFVPARNLEPRRTD
jgi:hypothetical protein